MSHEQADFDAIAAMLGFHLLKPSATPVLPLNLNLNVQEFLRQYQGALPFVRRQDLDKEPVQRANLVDTQSLNTIKGMSSATRIHVLDHHELRQDRPSHWQLEIDQVGACTTIIVEKLQSANTTLNTIHATLLLLGIYEDTGAMTYAHSTVRDVLAVAYLLEQGASLRIANRFLSPPLSSQQLRLYDHLLKNIQTCQIHGQKIIIACADASTMTDEISSIAHKMRDLLDPDALFLVVKTSAGIRLVARSTTDQINVAEIAAHFGGGGHERASAALLRTDSLKDEKHALDSICNDLQNVIEKYISPPITVSQLMSTGPTVLSPDTSAENAAQIMQRYGYEGYPVVKKGKVIGLLTRRAVDRALAHKLSLTAGSLMEAGEVFVFPHDSLQRLQRIMQKTGWGQIPVVDQISGNIIGIVTRTDVLKIITGEGPSYPSQQNLADDLEKALPAAHLALIKMIARFAHEKDSPAYIVGGFVRDLILNRPSLDFDIVIEGNAIEVCQTIAKEYGGKVTSHSRFGTAKWRIANIRNSLVKQLSSDAVHIEAEDLPESLDFISSRTEFYDYPTALPTVERSSIKLDLHRRDFTFNTLALRLDGPHYGDLYDYWGGLPDLRRGLIRVLHSLSFVDDPTRMLRAVRFEQRFGFQIEPRTLELMDEARSLLSTVTGQRLSHELDLILSEAAPEKMLARLQELHLLSAIHPDLSWSEAQTDPLHKVMNGERTKEWSLPEEINGSSLRVCLGYLSWLCRSSQQAVRDIAKRLRFSKTLQRVLLETNQLWKELPSLKGKKPSQITSRLDTVQEVTLYVLAMTTTDKSLHEMILQYIRVWRKIRPNTTGDTLRQMQIPPGPIYNRILTALRTAWLDGDLRSTTEEEQYLEKLLSEEE
ncbi:MAG: CBS domain-containing protein [Anaerolineaceae bacterium]|nr:CBS domain-containing protein [Anaerolineaceae bacterium]